MNQQHCQPPSPEPQESWEEEFDKKFGVQPDNPLIGYDIDIEASSRVQGSVKELKSFIKDLLEKERVKERARYDNELEIADDRWKEAEQEK